MEKGSGLDGNQTGLPFITGDYYDAHNMPETVRTRMQDEMIGL